MTGLIAISCRADLGRFIDNYSSVDALAFKSGWEQKKYNGWYSWLNKNYAVKEALEKNYSHILFIDDDMVVPHNLIEKLLKHDVDVVSCHLLNRYPPFEPYLYDKVEEDGRVHKSVIGDRTGLIEVKAIGLGGVLVKTEVFKKISDPWFETSATLNTEDIHFSKKCQDNGIKIHIDLQTMAGHIILGAVWPTFNNGKWNTTLVINNNPLINIPPASRDEDGTIRIKY